MLRFGFVMALWMSVLTAIAGDRVTMRSLLSEMLDPDANTYLPQPGRTARLWSSYDRKSITPDQPGWFANDDHSHFLSVSAEGENEAGLMLDAAGPGAITRFWITVAGNAEKGIIRIFVDGNLVVEGNCLEVVSGGKICGAPLSDSVAKSTAYNRRGHDLYLPIPYDKSCKVVYVRIPEAKGGAFYYNIETRSYPSGTEVESFSPEALKQYAPAIAEANHKLSWRMNGYGKVINGVLSLDGVIPPGGVATRKVSRSGGGAIRRMIMNLNSEYAPMLLRTTVMEIEFDGERTVWAPVGEFFGCGYTYEPYSSWFTACTGSNKLESRWVMPFERECAVTLHNYSDRAISVTGSSVELGDYAWDVNRSMHFGACWHEYADVPSRRGEQKEQYDFDFVELDGQGLLVGTAISLWQPVTDWWGEGDEKVFIDGESVPSFIGTGSEDYFGYAWGRYQSFDHPFIAQPIGIGNGSKSSDGRIRRNVVNLRHRVLDAIPFSESIKFHMEMWHWNKDIKLDFAPLACWYMRPGGRCNHGVDEEALKRMVRVDIGYPSPKRVMLPPTAKLFEDFDDGTYAEWIVEGDAFGSAPARGTLPRQNPVDGYSGKYLVNSYLNGDDTTGTLTSREFKIELPHINFLVGGGNFAEKTCVNLVVDGNVVRTATGKNRERLEWASWPVGEFKGRTARIVIVDRQKGGWGHINADCFYFDVAPRTE
ncbi:MAG: DUF2961 domain-containing protein [Kiritimatiellae bacterium]|nr:DUF2961 domain-containing protein [Kiritimatiellia bacterium]